MNRRSPLKLAALSIFLAACSSGPTAQDRALAAEQARTKEAEAMRAAAPREEKMREVLRGYKVGSTTLVLFAMDKDAVGGWHTHRMNQSSRQDASGKSTGRMSISMSIGTPLRPIADLVFEGEAGTDLVLRSLSLR